MNKKHFLFGTLTSVALLTAVLIPLSSQQDGSYDPWLDLNDDGVINVVDLQLLALIFGTSGKPIDKTALLLELEARIDSLNATLLTDYYDITDCDSLFALLSHLHSGSDISGGTLRADQIRLGSSEANHIIYFYDDGVEYGEFIYWHDAGDRFYVSDDMYVNGTITIPTTTRYLAMQSVAWLPFSSDYTFTRAGGVVTTTPQTTAWYMPVYLPQGAVVTEFTVWVWDTSSAYDIDATLSRTTAYGTPNTMAGISSSGSIPDSVPYTDSSVNYATINNEDYFYAVTARMYTGDTDHALGRVRITYTIDAFP